MTHGHSKTWTIEQILARGSAPGVSLVSGLYQQCNPAITRRYVDPRTGGQAHGFLVPIDVIEPFLIQRGLIQRTPRGRVLSDAGYRHLGLAAPRRDPAQFNLLDREDT